MNTSKIPSSLRPLAPRLAETALGLRARWGRGGVIVTNHIHDGVEIRAQVEALAPFFEFVHHDDLIRDPWQPRKKPFCLLTFDDGKRVNFEAALELEKLGVPAVFYICTRFVGGSKALWFDTADTLRHAHPELEPELRLGKLKSLPLKTLEAHLENLRRPDSPPTDLTDPRISALSREQVRTMHRRGFTIGAHTQNHAILTHEPVEEAKRDIVDSMRDVQSITGARCRTFAFPNGNHTRELADFAVGQGAETVMTTVPAWAGPADLLRQLPRIELHPKHDAETIRVKLTASLSGCVLRDPNGTGRKYVTKRFQQRLAARDRLR